MCDVSSQSINGGTYVFFSILFLPTYAGRQGEHLSAVRSRHARADKHGTRGDYINLIKSTLHTSPNLDSPPSLTPSKPQPTPQKAYLPWLVLRPVHDPAAEAARPLTREDIPEIEQQLGAKPLLGFYGLAGIYAMWWTLCGRATDVLPASPAARWASFLELVGSDRLMFAFTTELGLFALFQGVVVGDDARRRGLDPNGPLALVAKFVPFFGLFAYLMLRPPLPSVED